MRLMQSSGADLDRRRITNGLHGTDSEFDRKFWVALVLYGVLAVLVWFTMSGDKVFVFNRWVDLRLVPLIVIGGLALRTVLARQAENIRRRGESGS